MGLFVGAAAPLAVTWAGAEAVARVLEGTVTVECVVNGIVVSAVVPGAVTVTGGEPTVMISVTPMDVP
jgi:hypothetical protein